MELRELYRFALVFGAKGCSKQISEPPAVGRRPQHHFTAPTERTPSRGPASNGHPLVATMIGGGLEGYGPSQPLPAVNPHHFTAPTERRPPAPGDRPAMAHPLVATMIAGGLRSLEPLPAANPHRFHGADGADALQGLVNIGHGSPDF
jgi:hypothetical protein